MLAPSPAPERELVIPGSGRRLARRCVRPRVAEMQGGLSTFFIFIMSPIVCKVELRLRASRR